MNLATPADRATVTPARREIYTNAAYALLSDARRYRLTGRPELAAKAKRSLRYLLSLIRPVR